MSERYTEADYAAFRRLVLLSESQRQMARIESRLQMPKLIERLGKQVCDEMFERLKREEPAR